MHQFKPNNLVAKKTNKKTPTKQQQQQKAMKRQCINVHKTLEVDITSWKTGEQRIENPGEHSHLQKRKHEYSLVTEAKKI